jgi:propane monooxygenase reductase subunit
VDRDGDGVAMNDVKVQPFDEVLGCEDDETILGAVLRQGYFLRYGCKGGGCGTCKVLLVDGDVDEHGSSFALPSSERAKGWILACASIPVEDCVIDVESMEMTEEEFRAGDVTVTYDTELEVVEPLTHDIRFVRLRLVEPERMKFVAGQFVSVGIPGTGLFRSYSMANPPSADQVVELIVRVIPGGMFSSWLEQRARPGDRVPVQGPYGMLKIRLSHRRILMIAGGSGMAPILSMLEDLAEKGNERPVTLFFGARSERDLYLEDRLAKLGERMPLEFVPALSESWAPSWSGETGLVTEVLRRRLPSLEGWDAYMCGPPPMIDAATPLLVDSGVRARNIYFDAFAPTG